MIRRFNYTGRQKIARDKVSISLERNAESVLTFDADIDLSELGLPPSACVYLEAYRHMYYRRYSFGRVGSLVPPGDRSIPEIDDSHSIRFRLKVAESDGDSQRLLAVADRISPSEIEKEKTKGVSILPVSCEDLGNKLWNLKLEGQGADGPILEVNRRVSLIMEIARSDPHFQALVFPEVVRQVLTFIVCSPDYDEDDDNEDSWSLWLKFASGFPGCKEKPKAASDSTTKEEWVERVVQAFSYQQKYLIRYESTIAG